MNNAIAAGVLSVAQTTNLTNVTLKRKYDLVLGGLSWEQRCASSFRATSNLDANIKLLKFASRDSATEQKKLQSLKALKEHSKCEVVDLNASIAFPENAEKIERFIEDQYVSAGHSLSVLVDITCIPKSYILFLL